MISSLLNKYNEYHPEFLDSLSVLSENVRRKIIKRLEKESDKNNFLSTIVEIRFGRLFCELGFQAEYDKVFPNKQRPDWEIRCGEAAAICDVYRLGQSARDQIRSDFESQLIEKLQKIPQSYFLKISFAKRHIDSTLYDVEVIANEVREWLVTSPKEVGDKITIQGDFGFEIIKSRTDVEHV